MPQAAASSDTASQPAGTLATASVSTVALAPRMMASPTPAIRCGSWRAVSRALSPLLSSSPRALMPNAAPYWADESPIMF